MQTTDNIHVVTNMSMPKALGGMTHQIDCRAKHLASRKIFRVDEMSRYVRALSQGRHTVDRLEERGVEGTNTGGSSLRG